MTIEQPSSNERLATPPRKRRAWIIGALMPLVVLIPVWFLFIGPQMRHDRLIEKGTKANGRLLIVDETGTYVNDSPELELTVEFRRSDGVLDTAVTDFVPSRRSIHLFQQGVSVTAAYDPDDPSEITIVNLSTAPLSGFTTPLPTTSNVDSLQRVADSLRAEIESMKSH